MTLVGSAHGRYIDGRYSKFLPSRLQRTYDDARDDPNLLSLRNDVALVDSRLADLLSRVDTGESGQLWADLKKAHEDFKVYRLAGDVQKMTLALAKVETVIERATADHLAWREIAEQLEQRRKLAESEHKRNVSLHQMLTAEEALLLAKRFIDIITVHVTDKKALSAIIIDLQQMIGANQQIPVYAQEDEA